jgi:hypothetical protein
LDNSWSDESSQRTLLLLIKEGEIVGFIVVSQILIFLSDSSSIGS